MPRYIVRLTETERQQLEQMLAKGRHAASTAARARILLKADESEEGPGWTDGDIVRALDTSLSTAHRVRQEFVELGLEAALYRRKPTGRQYRKLDGTQEAQLIALACGAAPEGRARWTLKLLAQQMVELEIVDAIGPECVRTTLKKNELKPWLRTQRVIPPKANAESVCAVEDVLEVYTRPYDPLRPQVCLDECEPSNWWRKPAAPCPPNPASRSVSITNTGVAAPPTCPCRSSRWRGNAMSRSRNGGRRWISPM